MRSWAGEGRVLFRSSPACGPGLVLEGCRLTFLIAAYVVVLGGLLVYGFRIHVQRRGRLREVGSRSENGDGTSSNSSDSSVSS